MPSCCAPSLLEGYLEMLCLSHSQFSRHFGSLAQRLGLTPSSPGPQTWREAVAGKSPWPGRLGLDQTSCMTALVSKSYSQWLESELGWMKRGGTKDLISPISCVIPAGSSGSPASSEQKSTFTPPGKHKLHCLLGCLTQVKLILVLYQPIQEL